MHIRTAPQPAHRPAKQKTEVLRWASNPPAGAVLREITILTKLRGSGYEVFVLMQWERPPFAPLWVNRKVSHEMTATVSHTWPVRPSPAAILRAISDSVLAISTCPATSEIAGQMTLPGL